MVVTTHTLSAFGVTGATHAVGHRRDTCFAYVAGGCVDPVPVTTLDALSWCALRTVAVVIRTGLAGETGSVDFESWETTETLRRLVAESAVLDAFDTSESRGIQVMTDTAASAVRCNYRAGGARSCAGSAGVSATEESAFFAVVTDSGLVAGNAGCVSASVTGASRCKVADFALRAVSV